MLLGTIMDVELKLGMSVEEVIKLLGQPDRKSLNSRNFSYHYKDLTLLFWAPNNFDGTSLIWIKNEKEITV